MAALLPYADRCEQQAGCLGPHQAPTRPARSRRVPTGPLSDASLMCSTVEECAVGRARGEARMVSLVTAVLLLSIAPR